MMLPEETVARDGNGFWRLTELMTKECSGPDKRYASLILAELVLTLANVRLAPRSFFGVFDEGKKFHRSSAECLNFGKARTHVA